MEQINKPNHYAIGGIETIDFIKAKLGHGFNDYCLGNIIKYISRCQHKSNMRDDLLKAKQYIDYILENK